MAGLPTDGHSKLGTVDRKVLLIPLNDIKLYHTISLGEQGTDILAEWNNKLVVIKKINCTQEPTDVERDAFESELKVWKHISNENCVSMIGVIDEGPILGFVRKYFHHGGLNLKFRAGVSLNGIQAIQIATTISEAIIALHANNIAHRDIKSSSILLDENLKARLGSFGLARNEVTTESAPNSAIARLTHLAPEYMDSKAKIDELKGDIYSFGILMFELALGVELLQRNPVEDRSKPSCLSKEIRDKWWELANECSQKDPNLRPSIEQVHSTLESLSKLIPDFKCSKHGGLKHEVFISYCSETDKDVALSLLQELEQYNSAGEPLRVFLKSQCLPNDSDWDQTLLYGLHNSTILVPIISSNSWDSIKSADTLTNTILKEYENMFDHINLANAKIFPWFIGSSSSVQEFPDSFHFMSKRNIQASLRNIIRYSGANNSKEDVNEVATMIFNLYETTTNNSFVERRKLLARAAKDELDVGIILVGEEKPISMVTVTPESFVSDLRDAITFDGDITFKYKFIQPNSSGDPLTASAEHKSKVTDILDNQFIKIQKFI